MRYFVDARVSFVHNGIPEPVEDYKSFVDADNKAEAYDKVNEALRSYGYLIVDMSIEKALNSFDREEVEEDGGYSADED